VHHGGEPHAFEDHSYWGGYNIPRGAFTFHGLRYRARATEVRDDFLALPITDPGSTIGSGSGQWADHDYGMIMESRIRDDAHPNGYVREQTLDSDGQGHDLIYAANNSQHPDAPSKRFALDEGEMVYDLEEGWHVKDPSKLMHPNPMISFLRFNASARSSMRTKAFHKYTMQASGNIDADWSAALYRTPGIGYPAADELETALPDMMMGRRQLDLAGVGVRNAAFTAIMEPDAGDQGIYSGCVGPLNYDAVAAGGHGFYYYDETNTYWTIRLAATPEELVADASQRAKDCIQEATDALAGAEVSGADTLEGFLNEAKSALTTGQQILQAPVESAIGAEMARQSRALRRFAKSQVKARQVTEALNPPATLASPL
ncbi:MAG: hypothetical protein AAGF46_13165, partial [Pseudomonadota bacterium]